MRIAEPLQLPPHLQQTLRLAADYQQGGRLPEAEALYRQVLALHPGHPETLHCLGALSIQMGKPEAALPCLEQARQAEPGNAAHWLLLTQCLLELNRPKDAKKLIAEAIRKGLRHPRANELLERARSGRTKSAERAIPLKQQIAALEHLFNAGRFSEAESQAQALVQRDPKAGQGWHILAMARLAQSNYQAALEPLRRALKLKPEVAELHYNLGYVLERLDRPEEAVAAYRRAVQIKPNLAEAHNNLGNVLKDLKRYEEALAAYQRAAVMNPSAAEIRMNKGDALSCLGRLEEAVGMYRNALDLKPDLPEAYNSLSSVLGLLGRHEEALDASRQALRLKPNYFDALKNMGINLGKCLRLAEEAEVYRRALELRKDAVVYRNYGGTLLEMGRIAEALAAYRCALELDPGDLLVRSSLLALANYMEGIPSETLLAEARTYGEVVSKMAVPFTAHDNAPEPGRCLRVGLVSGDLGEHVVGHFLEGVLANLDRFRVELFAYSTACHPESAKNTRLRACVAHWREATPDVLNDGALARQIHEDGIDILVDLSGHTGRNRLPVFAWKPAPVQVAWLGYFATTGLAAMDYILADRWVLPPDEEGDFVEKPWRLPDSYYCFTPPDTPADVGKLPALENAYVTFGCFNNLTKLNDRVIACWARVLKAVPGSRLFLKSKALGDASVAAAYRERFASHGIGPERLRMEGASPRADYLAAFNAVDMALDPFPFPGGTTSVEGLWMGVPVLTLKGERFIGHQGETILHSAGLPEWIAENVEDYVAKAAAFAQDLEKLATLRAGLREQVLASPLFDAPRFARNLEDAFRGMWRKWCEQQTAVKSPQSLIQ